MTINRHLPDEFSDIRLVYLNGILYQNTNYKGGKDVENVIYSLPLENQSILKAFQCLHSLPLPSEQLA